MSQEIISVDLDTRSYDIVIGNGLLNAEQLALHFPIKNTVIISDTNVAKHHLSALEKALDEAGISHSAHIIPAGEKSKSFVELQALLDHVFTLHPERQITLIALGGGVVGDLTGFAASILLRGVNFIQIPTTILAQVDSSVGGKTGINHSSGKNVIGSFYQPKRVIIDLDLLRSLPKREFLAGYAEMAKYGLITDQAFFDHLVAHFDDLLALNTATLAPAIRRCCEIKADVVARDEKESGVRALLNLGHTFGHALEAELGYSDKLLHGEAVAIGMVMAADLSERLGHCPTGIAKKIAAHLDEIGLPSNLSHIAHHWKREAIFSHMRYDKKVEQGKLVFILLRNIGEAFVDKNVPEDVVKETIDAFIPA